MKTNEVNIRDPFVLVHDGSYYLYGTRSATCWGPADGFDCYVSADLENWEGPIEIFRRPEGFFADQKYWAPECVFHSGSFYLLATLGAGDRKTGVYALRSDSPTGPFLPFGQRLTPPDWASIDGTMWFEGDTPWLVFSHSFEDSPEGDICAVRLAADLSRAEGDPVKLFSAGEAPWARPVPFAKEEFGMDGDVYLSDGPCLTRLDGGKLYMTWSSWGERGYAVGAAVSDSGLVQGPWRQEPVPIFPADGGHGMMFRNLEGELIFVLHYPNDHYQEHPVFLRAAADGNGLSLEDPPSGRSVRES